MHKNNFNSFFFVGLTVANVIAVYLMSDYNRELLLTAPIPKLRYIISFFLLTGSFAGMLLIQKHEHFDVTYRVTSSTEVWAISCLFFITLAWYGNTFSYNPVAWPAIAEVPIVLRIIDPAYNHLDFYTNAASNSPKIVFASMIAAADLVGLNWFKFFQVATNIVVLSSPIVYYFTCKSIFEHPSVTSKIRISDWQKITLSIFFSTPIFLFLQQDGASPLGWEAIETYRILVPMNFAFFFGSLALLASLRDKKYTSRILLLFAAIIHPIIGLFFLFPMLFQNYQRYKFQSCRVEIFYFHSLIDSLIVAIPALILYIFLFRANSVDAQLFNETYIKLRHPHHYNLASLIHIGTYIWIALFLSLNVIAYSLKIRWLINLTKIITISVLFPIIIHYVGAEIFNSKQFAAVGLNRFSAFYLWIWKLTASIVFACIIDEMNKRTVQNKEHNGAQDAKRKSPRFVFLLVGTIGCFSYITTPNSIKDFLTTDEREIVEWLNLNTNKSSTIQPVKFNPFWIRILAERAVYADSTFPFTENSLREFSKRYQLHLSIEESFISTYECNRPLAKIDHFVVPRSLILNNHFLVLIENESWKVIKPKPNQNNFCLKKI